MRLYDLFGSGQMLLQLLRPQSHVELDAEAISDEHLFP